MNFRANQPPEIGRKDLCICGPQLSNGCDPTMVNTLDRIKGFQLPRASIWSSSGDMVGQPLQLAVRSQAKRPHGHSPSLPTEALEQNVGCTLPKRPLSSGPQFLSLFKMRRLDPVRLPKGWQERGTGKGLAIALSLFLTSGMRLPEQTGGLTPRRGPRLGPPQAPKGPPWSGRSAPPTA